MELMLAKANFQNALVRQEWMPLPLLGGLYEVCKYGYVRNSETKKVLAPATDEKGYKKVALYDRLAKKCRTVKVHRAVALTFLPNPLNKPEVNHIDGNKANNHKGNLEWATHAENAKHAFATGLNHPNRPQLGKFNEGNHRSKKILQIDLLGNVIKEWPSAREAERHGFNSCLISMVCTGRKKTHKGFIWKYSN